MQDFSLYVLDIVQNSLRAGAKQVDISLRENGDWLDFSVSDDGCGMTPDQLERLDDPFFTTRRVRRVGLGVPLLKMLAQMTGGDVLVLSNPRGKTHGTTLTARFGRHHIDFVPLGDLPATVVTLIQGSPEVDFTFTHDTEKGTVQLSTAPLRARVGDEISLSEPEILRWISGYLREQYKTLEIHI